MCAAAHLHVRVKERNLEHGVALQGLLRDPESLEALLQAFLAFGERLQLVRVPDGFCVMRGFRLARPCCPATCAFHLLDVMDEMYLEPPAVSSPYSRLEEQVPIAGTMKAFLVRHIHDCLGLHSVENAATQAGVCVPLGPIGGSGDHASHAEFLSPLSDLFYALRNRRQGL